MILPVYRFFCDLAKQRRQFSQCEKLTQFPFCPERVLERRSGAFPDLILRAVRCEKQVYSGEFIEIKDSRSLKIASFNSSIPAGQKSVLDITNEGTDLWNTIDGEIKITDQTASRDVYYLVRGRNMREGIQKICLVHGSFFETVPVIQNIEAAFSRVFDDAVKNTGVELPADAKEKLLKSFSRQKVFNKTRSVENASVHLRFRLMAEACTESNLFNRRQYPRIADNSLNLLTPLHGHAESEQAIQAHITAALSADIASKCNVFKIKHPFNGYFLCFQIGLA